MGGGGRKLGAYSILATMLTGLVSWVINLGHTQIPNMKSQINVNVSSIQNNKEGIQEIKSNLESLREGQTKILEILIERR